MPTDPEIAKIIPSILQTFYIDSYDTCEDERIKAVESASKKISDLISKAIAEAGKEVETLEKMVLEYSGTTVPRLHLRIKELESQLTTIRSETIDECAKVAETEMKWFKEKDGNLALACTVLIVDAIRKLKG